MAIRALDVSTLARWLGPPTGMLRVERELAVHALTMPDVVALVVYDPSCLGFRRIRPEWAKHILHWSGFLWDEPALPSRRGWRRIVPSRLSVIMALESRRLMSGSSASASGYDLAQRLVLAAKAADFPLDNPDGRRIDRVPSSLAVGEPLKLGQGDRFLTPASDWWYKDPEVIRAIARAGARVMAVCYDILPLTHPQWFPARDVERFRQHWNVLFACAHTVIVNSEHVRHEVADYCSLEGFDPPELKVAPLGALPLANALEPAPPSVLPYGLTPGRFALYVSTIEPRKNHAMLLRAWRRLVDAEVPRRLGFKLVLAGRRGWWVDDVLDLLAGREGFTDSVVHLENVSDPELGRLYREAAFCLYPSRTEGFGLPVVEAYARGKAVIVSSGGSLPEAAAGYAPCLDPDDEEGWALAIRDWIEHPSKVADAERRIREARPFLTWPIAAQNMLELAGLTPEAAA